jgi:hypothetical protein
VDPDLLISGQLVVEEAGRRNRNFKVTTGPEGGLFVKQPRTMAPEATLTLQREGDFYRLVQELIAFSPVRRIVPRLMDHNRMNHSLVLELLPGWENLHEHHARVGSYPVEVGARMGTAMGSYHANGARIQAEPADLSLFPRQVPWILTVSPSLLQQGAGGFGTAGPAFQLLLNEFPGLMQQVQQLASHWHLDGLIHGDMKWDNILVDPSEQGAGMIRVVDWELADLGDAAWDVSSIWAAYLMSWVFGSMTGSTDAAPPTSDELSARLQAIRPALLAFWDTYRSSAGMPADDAGTHRLRSLQFCGARLATSAFECLHNQPGNLEPPRRLLGLAAQLLRYPRESSVEVFGA